MVRRTWEDSMNEHTEMDRAKEFPETIGKALQRDDRPDVDIKLALNELIWRHAKPDTTIGEADKAACAAFDVIWPLCEKAYPNG
jgi:hypothetical protein